MQLASNRVIEKINAIQLDYIICCTQAASRTQLSVEAGASQKEIVLQTKVDLEELVAGATVIEISHDCGKFVCERECVRTRGSLLFSVGLFKPQLTHVTLYLCPHFDSQSRKFDGYSYRFRINY